MTEAPVVVCSAVVPGAALRLRVDGEGRRGDDRRPARRRVEAEVDREGRPLPASAGACRPCAWRPGDLPCSWTGSRPRSCRQSLATTMTRWLKVDVPVFETSRWNPIFPPKVTCWTSLEVVPISGLRTTLAPVSVDRPPADPTAMQNATRATPAAKSVRFPLISLPPSSRLRRPTAGPRAAEYPLCSAMASTGDLLPEADAAVLVGARRQQRRTSASVSSLSPSCPLIPARLCRRPAPFKCSVLSRRRQPPRALRSRVWTCCRSSSSSPSPSRSLSSDSWPHAAGSSAGERPVTETDAERRRTEQEFEEAERYQAEWREEHKHDLDHL